MSDRHDKTDRSAIVSDILAYLSEHPDARDTLEGIVQWWLLRQKIHRETSLVAEAVSTLVREGLLRVDHDKSGSQPVYCLNRNEQDGTVEQRRS